MRGLLLNNFFASLSNVKLFSAVMFVSGVFVVAVDNAVPSLLIGYMLLSMVGFSINSISSLRKENASKWGKYKLTVPVKRTAIIKSYFISQLLWLLVGILFAGACVSLSIFLHGFPFDGKLDILMLFTAGIGVSLLTGAIFFPLFYLGGDERNEAILVISLICAVGLIMGLISFINWFFGPKMTALQLILAAAVIVSCAFAVFLLSYPLTVSIFKRKEY